MNCCAIEQRIGIEGTSRAQADFQPRNFNPFAVAPAQLPVSVDPPPLLQPLAPPKIQAAVQYMMQNFNKPISISTLSSMADLSPGAFFLSFKRATGHPPLAFLIRFRMKLAAKLLKQTNLQVKQIAAMVGYPDEFHFSRRFKSAVGVAPLHYRTRSEQNQDAGSKIEPRISKSAPSLMGASAGGLRPG